MRLQKLSIIVFLVCIVLAPFIKADNFTVSNSTDELFKVDLTGNFYLYPLTTCGKLYTDGAGLLTCGTDADTTYSHLSNFTDDIGVSSDWDAIGDVPVATPNDGDTTHLSTADQIYDWVISLSYATTTYADSLGNWTADKGDYSTTAEAGALYAAFNYNPFDQSLNITDDVQFNDATVNSIILDGDAANHKIYDNESCIIMQAGTTYFEVCE